ncbi:MAG TPA: hypothetical protein VIY86_08245, partial [Pirellulaceae bacterium]
GSWRFDSDTPDSDPDPTTGVYDQTNPGRILEAQFGAVPVASESVTMQMLDNAVLGIGTLDRYGAIGTNLTSYEAGSKTIALQQFHVFLTDSSLAAHANDALLAWPPDASHYDPCQGGFAQGQLIGREVRSNDLVFVNFCVRPVVPEPAGLTTAATGLIGLLLSRRRSIA